MVRYVGLVVAVSLLALSGCVGGYPYGYNGYGGYGGGYGGYSGYGGYPAYGSPYGSQQYGAPYCPPPSGYSYDPYAAQYGYGYGSAPGVVVPTPVPPVVVQNPPVGQNPIVVENPPLGENLPAVGNPQDDPTTDQMQARRRRQLAGEKWKKRYPNSPDPGSTGPQTNSDPTQPPASGEAALPPEAKGQAAMERRREMLANRSPQSGGATTNSGALDQANRPRTPMTGDAGRQFETWHGDKRNAATQPQMRPQQQANPFTGAAQRPQVRQSPVRQPSGPTATPRLSSPSPRPMMAGAPSAPRGQMSQARGQAQAPAQARSGAKPARQAPQ
jgi:hypothetical protein